MSAVRLVWLPLCSPLRQFISYFSFIGPAGQPKAFLTGADREACGRPSEVGTRIQVVPREHGWLHEPSGPKTVRSSLAFFP